MDINDYVKPKFRIKIDKLSKGDLQFGLFFNQRMCEFYNHTYDKVVGKSYERYIYLCLFKINISIGWII